MPPACHPPQQPGDIELLRPGRCRRAPTGCRPARDSGRERSCRAPIAQQVADILDDAERGRASRFGIAADRAGIDGVEVAALRARLDRPRSIGERRAERPHQGLALLRGDAAPRGAPSAAPARAARPRSWITPLDFGEPQSSVELEARGQGQPAGDGFHLLLTACSTSWSRASLAAATIRSSTTPLSSG